MLLNKNFTKNNFILLIIAIFMIFASISNIDSVYAVEKAIANNTNKNSTNLNTSLNNNTTSSLYSIIYFDKSVGGDVLKNSKISKNMPKSALSKEIVSMCKKGSVILKFGNGNGPKMLLCAGIHGDESAANIATLNFLETIKNKEINGTIYVIPFIMPKSTAIDKRNWYNHDKRYNVDPNRYSHIPGTPGYKIVQFAKKNDIKFIIDIHSGQGLNSYKNGFIFANKKPVSKQETQWLNYIKKTVKPGIIYNTPEKGYIRGYSRANGITTLTFEVEKNRGSVSHRANIEYKMLINACKYFKLF